MAGFRRVSRTGVYSPMKLGCSTFPECRCMFSNLKKIIVSICMEHGHGLAESSGLESLTWLQSRNYSTFRFLNYFCSGGCSHGIILHGKGLFSRLCGLCQVSGLNRFWMEDLTFLSWSCMVTTWQVISSGQPYEKSRESQQEGNHIFYNLILEVTLEADP